MNGKNQDNRSRHKFKRVFSKSRAKIIGGGLALILGATAIATPKKPCPEYFMPWNEAPRTAVQEWTEHCFLNLNNNAGVEVISMPSLVETDNIEARGDVKDFSAHLNLPLRKPSECGDQFLPGLIIVGGNISTKGDWFDNGLWVGRYQVDYPKAGIGLRFSGYSEPLICQKGLTQSAWFVDVIGLLSRMNANGEYGGCIIPPQYKEGKGFEIGAGLASINSSSLFGVRGSYRSLEYIAELGNNQEELYKEFRKTYGVEGFLTNGLVELSGIYLGNLVGIAGEPTHKEGYLDLVASLFPDNGEIGFGLGIRKYESEQPVALGVLQFKGRNGAYVRTSITPKGNWMLRFEVPLDG